MDPQIVCLGVKDIIDVLKEARNGKEEADNDTLPQRARGAS